MQKKSNSRRKLNRRQLRDLDVEIGFMEGLIRRDPRYIEALQVLGDDYTRRGRFDESLHVDERLVTLRPSDPMAFYNLACSCALTGQIEDAAAALSQARSCTPQARPRCISTRNALSCPTSVATTSLPQRRCVMPWAWQ